MLKATLHCKCPEGCSALLKARGVKSLCKLSFELFIAIQSCISRFRGNCYLVTQKSAVIITICNFLFHRHLACEEESLQAVEILLERGALADKVNKAGKTPAQMTSSLPIRRRFARN